MLIYRKEFYLLFQSDLVRISYTPSYRCSTWALSRKIVDLHLLISADVHQPYISLFFTLQTDLLAHFWKQLFPSHLLHQVMVLLQSKHLFVFVLERCTAQPSVILNC